MKPHKVLIAVAAASAALATTMSTASAKDELGAVTALQLTNTIAKSFVRNYLEAANQAKGPVKIKYVGGQEVVPPRKAANALKRGQFDLLSCPTAYYIGTVPEGYALLAANQGVWKSLTKAQQGFLKAQALEYETTSIHWLEGERAKEEKILHAAGVKDIALSGGTAERYLDLAHQEIWTQLKDRSEYHDRLKPLMYIPGKPNRQVDIGRALRQ